MQLSLVIYHPLSGNVLLSTNKKGRLFHSPKHMQSCAMNQGTKPVPQK